MGNYEYFRKIKTNGNLLSGPLRATIYWDCGCNRHVFAGPGNACRLPYFPNSNQLNKRKSVKLLHLFIDTEFDISPEELTSRKYTGFWIYHMYSSSVD